MGNLLVPCLLDSQWAVPGGTGAKCTATTFSALAPLLGGNSFRSFGYATRWLDFLIR